MKILNFDPKIDLKQCLLWQYNNAPSLRALISQKEAYYKENQTDFWNYWYNSIFNIDTADDFGLNVWGEILDFPRQIKSTTGNLHTLTTDQYRNVLKGQMLKFNMGVSAPEVNEWLKVVFGAGGSVYCLDNLDMTAIPFVFEQDPSDEILWLLQNFDFLPRPAGVGYEVKIYGEDVFGFDGSGLETFNNGTFYYDYNQDITTGQYQLIVNAPEGAKVYINNVLTNYVSLTENTPFTISVTGPDMIPFNWEAALSEDLTFNISQLVVNNRAGANVLLNGQNVKGAYFLGSFTYSLSAQDEGLLPFSAQQTINTNTEINIYKVKIIPSPANSTVVFNGQNALGALFTGSLSYSYTVSLQNYNTVSGTGTAYGNLDIPVSLTLASWSKSRTGISGSLGTGVITLDEYRLPITGRYNISLAGEGTGTDQEIYKNARGGISQISAILQQNDTVSFKVVSNGPNNSVSMALYVNGTLIAVSGGGGHGDDGKPFYGGCGYIAGGVNTGDLGLGIIGGINNREPQGADGSYAEWIRYPQAQIANYAYGGQGYAISGDGRFTISQTPGKYKYRYPAQPTTSPIDVQGNANGAYYNISLIGE